MLDYDLINFCVDLKIDEEEVADKIDIGDHEYVFVLTNGDKYLYDPLKSYPCYIKPRPKDDDNLTEMEWRKEFARKLKKKLRYEGITQHELSQMINISETSISKYICEKATATGYVISKIARAIDCSAEELTNFNYLL